MCLHNNKVLNILIWLEKTFDEVNEGAPEPEYEAVCKIFWLWFNNLLKIEAYL
jgi:hypothetical protein